MQIDDGFAFAQLVRQSAEEWPGIRHVSSATTGRQGIEECRSKLPDIVLLEAFLWDQDGITVADELFRLSPKPRVILMTSILTDVLLYRIATRPFSGLVWKGPQAIDDLRMAISEVSAGRTFFSDGYEEAKEKLWQKPEAFFKIFTEKDQELLTLFGQGCSNSEVADRLCLAPSTVRTYRQRLLDRLGFHRTIDLMRYASEIGLVRANLPAAPCILARAG
jgi:DNA-binding NarL/FixJ family response regulator